MVAKFTGIIVALDIATVTGFAYGRPDKTPKFDSVRFAKPGASRAACHRAFREWLDATWNVRGHQPDLIVYEAPIGSLMKGATHIETIKRLIGMCEHLEEWCHGKIELREANVAQIRHHFIGDNPRSKQAKAMTIARCNKLKWMVNNDNEADALALWDFQVCCLRPDIATQRTPLFLAKRPATV